MKELDFNTENSVKVVKAMENGLALEYGKEVIKSMITGEQPDQLLAGMAKTATLFVDILTKEIAFRDALKFLSGQGVTIERWSRIGQYAKYNKRRKTIWWT